jgi:hypothetical protein
MDLDFYRNSQAKEWELMPLLDLTCTCGGKFRSRVVKEETAIFPEHGKLMPMEDLIKRTVWTQYSCPSCKRRIHEDITLTLPEDNRLSILIAALERIVSWDGFPRVGKCSYFDAYGMVGERDYMRAIARKALKEVNNGL